MESNDNHEIDDLKQKKQYLTEEIINKGYNPNDFINLCQSKKENGDDLENWTFEELRQCVEEFQNQHQKNNENNHKKVETSMKDFLFTNSSNKNNNYNNPNYLQSSQINQRINENIQNVNIGSNSVNYNEYNNNSNYNPKIYKKEINCKILDKTELNSKKINVKIKNPKQITSLISPSYTVYEVYTKEFGWLVNRRYSDFDWLRNTLRKIFPRYVVPPLPSKKMGARRFDQDFIEKRMKFLQKFIDEVVEVETFKASEALIAFLKMTDREQFDRKIKEMNSLICSNYIQDIKTLSGKLTVVDNENYEKYSDI